MLPRERTSPAGLRTALSALGFFAACAFQPPPEWPRILADVRAKHPSVPQVTIEELLAQEADPGPVLLDARTREEYEVSHLRGARLAPDEESALAALQGLERGREIVVYCSVGMRSSELAEKLAARGFGRVANLEGGIFAWANAGLATYRGEERTERVHPFDPRWGLLLAPERRADVGSR